MATGVSARCFDYETEVTFGECDPAGILYYPRYFDLFHRTMEAWFGRCLGFNYATLVGPRGLGFPAVHSEADFARPSWNGEQIVVSQRLLRRGQHSLDFGYEVRGTSEAAGLAPRVSGRTVVAVVELSALKGTLPARAIDIPDDLRVAIDAYQAGES